MATIQVFFGAELQSGRVLDDKDEITVGRAASNDIVIDNAAVSRLHCTFRRIDTQWTVQDANSANGIFVNGERVQHHTLSHRDRIVVGKHTLLFNQWSGDAGEAAEEERGDAEESGVGTVFLGREALARLKQRSQSQTMALVLTGPRRVVVPLERNLAMIGAGEHCDLRIRGWFVKPVQATVVKTERGHRVIHQGGPRSLFVNGDKQREALLRAGDILAIAGQRISYGSL